MKKLYSFKIFDENEEYCQLFFQRFEDALAAIVDNKIFEEYVPDSLLDTLESPKWTWASHPGYNGIADIFELRYSNGVFVRVGKKYYQNKEIKEELTLKKKYKVEIHGVNLHIRNKFENLDKAKRYASIMQSINPAASIILYERHRFFWWKEYEERKDD